MARIGRRTLMAGVLLVGIALRLWIYAGGRSLWHDETLIALGLIHLPLPALFGELPFDQMAPVGWLLAERAVYELWPNVDFGLRLLSLVGGIGALFAHWWLSRLALTDREALLSVGLFAFASALIRYSAMVKPYVWDAFFSALILALALRLLHEADGRLRLTGLLAFTGFASILFSFGALTVLAPTGILLFVRAVTCRDRRWIMSLVLVGLVWTVALGALYLLDYGRQATIADMVGLYWVDSFAPMPTSMRALLWYYHAPASVLGFLLAGLPAVLLMLGVVIGAVAACRRSPWLGALLVGPFATALLAAAAHAYPLETRFHLALASPAILLLAYAVGAVARLSRKPALTFGILGIPLLALPAAATARQALRTPPWAMEEIEPNLVRLQREASASDFLLVTPFAERALLLYAPKVRLGPRSYLVTENRPDSRCWTRGLGALPERGRIWFITYHERETWPSTAAVLESLRSRGVVSTAGAEPGSMLYRIELDRRLPELSLPSSCYARRNFSESLDALAVRQGLRPVPLAAPR